MAAATVLQCGCKSDLSQSLVIQKQTCLLCDTSTISHAGIAAATVLHIWDRTHLAQILAIQGQTGAAALCEHGSMLQPGESPLLLLLCLHVQAVLHCSSSLPAWGKAQEVLQRLQKARWLVCHTFAIWSASSLCLQTVVITYDDRGAFKHNKNQITHCWEAS